VCAAGVFNAGILDSGTTWWLTVMGRLAPGTSVETTTAQFAALSPGIFEQIPANYPPESVAAYRAFALVAEPAGARRVAASAAVRRRAVDPAGDRRHRAADRGGQPRQPDAGARQRAPARNRRTAGHRRVARPRGRQLLAESALLAALGASLGAAVAGTLGQALIAFLRTDRSAVVLQLDLNWRAFGFTTFTATVCAMLFGLAPAVRSTRIVAGEALKAGSRGATADRQRFLLRRALVVCQLALSLALVVCAFQFVATFRALASLDAGFRQDGIVEATVDFRSLSLPPDRRTNLRVEVLDRIRAIPGVRSASSAVILPVSGASTANAVWLDGAARDRQHVSNFNMVSDGYFATLGVPVLAGRDFDPRLDVPASPKVAVVNETFARRFLKPGHPLGQGILDRADGEHAADALRRDRPREGHEVSTAARRSAADCLSVLAPTGGSG
jgi:hypothetical protein